MSDSKSTSSNVFNVETVRSLVELMKQHDLSELDLREGDQKISLKRGGQAPIYAAPAPMQAAPAPAAPTAPATSGGGEAPAADSHLVAIKSPMVGTFYSKPKPDAETFARIGDHVSDDSVVCIIEAMKVFNEIKAELSGKIVKVLVKDEEPVEYGQTLFMVDPQG